MAERCSADYVFSGDVQMTGTGSIPDNSVTNAKVISTASIARSKLATDTSQLILVPPTHWRVWDAPQTVLPNPSANDDLGLYDGTFGTSCWYIGTSDLKTAGATSRYARCQIAMPPEYYDGGGVIIRFLAGMITTVADTTATIDCEAYEIGTDGTAGADLCATSATTINNLVFANKDFTITPTNLVSGDLLDVRVTIAVNDGAGATAVIGAFYKAFLVCTLQG